MYGGPSSAQQSTTNMNARNNLHSFSKDAGMVGPSSAQQSTTNMNARNNLHSFSKDACMVDLQGIVGEICPRISKPVHPPQPQFYVEFKVKQH